MVEMKPGAKVSFRGVCSYTVETAKNGSNFIKGTVRDRKDVVAFKIWDATSLEVDLLKVVKITGLVKEYNKETYIEATEAVNDEGNILDFVETSVLDTSVMLEDLHGMAKMCSEAWAKTLETVLAEQEGVLLVASLPNSAHSERGGFLAHIHEAAFSVMTEINRMERLGTPLNKDVIIPGVILAKLYNVENFTFDAVTGEATSEKVEMTALLGSTESFLRSYRVVEGLPFSMEVVNVVGAVNYITDPATPEAIVVREAYDSELAAYEAMKLSSNTKVGNVAKGTRYTFIGSVPNAE